jgi:type IX secretion system PorP/SprF family membrane protein
MTMRRLIYIAILLLSATPSWAQQEPLYSNYLSNKMLLNPAYAGSREQLALILQGRRQWAGFAGAPKTEVLTAHLPTPDLRHGFGIALVNDRWGHTSTTLVAGNYAYRIPVGEAGHLALGLKAGFKSYRIQYQDVPLWDAGDAAFNGGNNYSKAQLVVAPGLYFQNDYFYGGVSVSDMLPHRLYEMGAGAAAGKTATHVFAMAGGAIPMGGAIKLKPSILLRAVGGAPVGLDLTLAAAYKDRITAGFTWRPRNAMAFWMQAYLTKAIQLGYAYDLDLGATRNFATGGHELLLGFDLNFLKRDIEAPKPF